MPCRATFGLFCTLGCSFWLVLGEIQILRQYFAKKYTCIDLASNFLQIFRMQIIFPRPGGGTIAAGNRDSPPGRLRPTAGACWDWVTVCVFPSRMRMHPFPAVGLVFAVFFFFLGGFHPGSLPFPPLSVVFWSPLGALLVESGLSCFRYVFLECFWTIFDVFLTSFFDWFYMFFASLFELCFCLLFPRTFFKCMHTFKTRDLQKTLFFFSKNAIFEDPPLQKKFQNLLFWG